MRQGSKERLAAGQAIFFPWSSRPIPSFAREMAGRAMRTAGGMRNFRRGKGQQLNATTSASVSTPGTTDSAPNGYEGNQVCGSPCCFEFPPHMIFASVLICYSSSIARFKAAETYLFQAWKPSCGMRALFTACRPDRLGKRQHNHLQTLQYLARDSMNSSSETTAGSLMALARLRR